MLRSQFPQVAEALAAMPVDPVRQKPGLPACLTFPCVALSISLVSGLWRLHRSTREALLSEAGFENVFRTQNWARRARRRKLFCR